MTSFGITIWHNLGSLAFGIGAWALAYFAIVSKKAHVSYRFSVSSFSLCICSLVLQLFEVSNRVNANDFSAIADTIRAVSLASCILVGITILLNIVALLRKRKK